MAEGFNQPVDFKISNKPLVAGWSVIVMEKWAQALKKYKVGVTGSLMRSFEKQLVLANGDVDKVILKFLKYGRFRDMNVGRGQDLNGIVLNRRFDRYRDVDGKITGGLTRRKAPWYSKTFFKEVAKLSRLMREQYGEQIVQILETALHGSINLPL